MQKRLWIPLILGLLLIGASVPALAQDNFQDDRLNQEVAAPIVIFCRFDGGLEIYNATGGGALDVTEDQIEGALAQSVLDETAITVAIGNGGAQVIVFPDGGILVTAASAYQYTLASTDCGGYQPDYTTVVRIVDDIVEVIGGEIDDEGNLVIVEDTIAATYFGTVSADGTRTHVVQRGENLFRIGLRYGVPYQTLAAVNGINADRIFVGQIITIP